VQVEVRLQIQACTRAKVQVSVCEVHVCKCVIMRVRTSAGTWAQAERYRKGRNTTWDAHMVLGKMERAIVT
jgi:hypothetical protein